MNAKIYAKATSDWSKFAHICEISTSWRQGTVQLSMRTEPRRSATDSANDSATDSATHIINQLEHTTGTTEVNCTNHRARMDNSIASRSRSDASDRSELSE